MLCDLQENSVLGDKLTVESTGGKAESRVKVERRAPVMTRAAAAAASKESLTLRTVQPVNEAPPTFSDAPPPPGVTGAHSVAEQFWQVCLIRSSVLL